MIPQIRPADLDRWLAEHATEQPLVLDVREGVELRVAQITADGFELQHIPMGDVPERLEELDPARPIACMCHHGVRSMQVAVFLARNGYQQVVNIQGGIEAWAVERDPTVGRY